MIDSSYMKGLKSDIVKHLTVVNNTVFDTYMMGYEFVKTKNLQVEDNLAFQVKKHPLIQVKSKMAGFDFLAA